jgi:glycosyltransferase involved in cell wall biosynthesis
MWRKCVKLNKAIVENENRHVGAILIAFNAERTLEKFIAQFPREYVKTIILVDDCSKDKTYDIARRLDLQAYRNPVNLGYGGNLKRALAIANEQGLDIIVDIHPDGEYEPTAIPLALEAIKNGADFVIGNRFDNITKPLSSGMYLWKFPLIVILNFITRFLLPVKLNDFHQGFRVYTKKMLSEINFEANSNGYLFSFEIIVQAIRANLKIVEVPVTTHYSGKKRGADLKSCIVYTLGVFKVLTVYLLTVVRERLSGFRQRTSGFRK